MGSLEHGIDHNHQRPHHAARVSILIEATHHNPQHITLHLSVYTYTHMSPRSTTLRTEHIPRPGKRRRVFVFQRLNGFLHRGYSPSLHITSHHQRQRHTNRLLQRAPPLQRGCHESSDHLSHPFSLHFFPQDPTPSIATSGLA
jgi:hypothetical protein